MKSHLLKYYYILSRGFLLAGILLLGSCTQQLFQEPITSKNLNTFLSTEIEVEEYANAVYANLQSTGLYGLYLPAFGEIASDNTFDEVPANDDGIYGQLDEFTTLPSNGIVTTTWRDSYQTIQKANVVLNRIGKVSYQNEQVKSARMGEMRFIRALLYFNLVRLYGDVPLVTDETSNPNSYFGQGRTAASAVYEQIIQDLNTAVSELPVSSAQAGRVIKTAAHALLGKVYLTQGNYKEARTQLSAVIASNLHTLMDIPADVFSISNENNKEILFAVQFASGINGNSEGSTMFQQFSPSGTQSGAKGHNLPTKSLYALYQPEDLRRDTYVKLSKSGIPYTGKLTKPTAVITDGGSDIVVLRYADVVLMLAECENELGNIPEATDYLNRIRVRAGVAPLSELNPQQLRAAISRERQLELIGEGHRWFDLLRTGKALQVMNQWFADNNKSIIIDSHHLLMPVPQSQINTDPSIKQNTGY